MNGLPENVIAWIFAQDFARYSWLMLIIPILSRALRGAPRDAVEREGRKFFIDTFFRN